MLSIKNYRKSYNNQLILDIPLLDLDHGIYWFKGDNGSGKSTLFKSICGIISFEGDCRLDGFSVKKDSVDYRNLVSYSEAEPLYPEFLTLKDLVTFARKTRKAGQKQVDDIISKIGTADYYHQPVKTYSSGMLKKVGLVMAFLGAPKLIILDEPFITIDQKTTKSLVTLIRDYYQEGITFLISSHITAGSDQLPITNIFRINNQMLEIER